MDQHKANHGHHPMSGIILAGGKNSRMGTNKAFLEIGGTRLIDRSLEVYRQLFPEIIIVTNDPVSYLEFSDASVVTDIYKGKGPLGGIYTGLFYAKYHYAFVCPCDMPSLNRNFIACMMGLAGHHDVVVPEVPGGYQALHAIYSRTCLPSIKRLLLMDQLKVTGFYRDMRVLTIKDAQIRPFDPDGLLFQNLNTPEDVNKING